MGDAATDVIYEAPGRTRAWWGAALGALVFFSGLAWIVVRMLRRPWVVAAVLALVALALAAPSLLGQRAPLRARRVLADGAKGELRVEHRRGVEVVAFADLESVASGEVTLAEGVPIDVVTVSRKGGGAVSFSVIDRGAAEGAARAIRAVAGLAG